MDGPSLRARVAALARRHLHAGDPLGWFEALYQAADGDAGEIPWADLRPNPMLERWLAARPDLGGTALVVGCGLGDDAEALARAGWTVTAFDVSTTSIAWCRRRFAHSRVDYQVADLLQQPPAWRASFDLVAEIYTLQSLPPSMRPAAIDALIDALRVGGRLLVITRGRDDAATPSGPPWPVSVAELEQLTQRQLSLDRFEDFYDDEAPPQRRFVALYRRRAPLIAPIETDPPSDPTPEPDDGGIADEDTVDPDLA